MDEDVNDRVERDGHAIIEDVLSADALAALSDSLAGRDDGAAVRRRSSVYAIRNLLDVIPAVKALSQSPAIRPRIDAILGVDAIAVRGILFDKTPDANWTVPWHQDLAIAVREQVEMPGFTGWSVKAGVPHVQPPASILEHMLSVRVHLDDCGDDNGPLDVLSGSHRHGRLTQAEVERWRDREKPVPCLVRRGGLLLMRPLLLHRSLSATSPQHRRVIHIEYANVELPPGLNWYQARDEACHVKMSDVVVELRALPIKPPTKR
jgi:ectoine hydroxylase-related dioxygenase (phytanoyl-CoA dioxygenase family)